ADTGIETGSTGRPAIVAGPVSVSVRRPVFSLSLAPKWAPTENHAFDKAPYHFAKRLAALLFPASSTSSSSSSSSAPFSAPTVLKQYRQLLSELRSHLNVVERLMCSREWSRINFSSVPARAHQKLKSAFLKHDKQRYEEYLTALKAGKDS